MRRRGLQARRVVSLNRNAGRRRRASESGAAMIIALTAVFVLSTMGGIALLASLSNSRMSETATVWTSDYYALDAAAEHALETVDQALLAAERHAQAYMRDELYRSETAPLVTGDPDTEIGEAKQNYIHNRWLAEVRGPSVEAAKANGGLGAAPDGDDGVTIDVDTYDALFARFHEEFFARLYYSYAQALLEGLGPIGQNGGTSAAVAVSLDRDMESYASMRDGDAPSDGGLSVEIGVSDSAASKTLDATIAVLEPKFGHVTETQDIPFRANPVWTNALTARGTITFAAGSASIYGDAVAQDYNERYASVGDYASREGNRFGIVSAGGAVDIYGNALTRGDLHVTEDGGAIAVRRYPAGLSIDYKTGAYGTTLYLDASSMPASIQRYVQLEGESWTRGFLPFFYRDSLGGNVYCNNLSIDAGVERGEIFVGNGKDDALSGGDGSSASAGVVWTLDDVTVEGELSQIEIQGNLIGLSSETAFSDHMSSSAVINGSPGSSKIYLGGAAIVPGTAFMRFDGVNDLVGETTYYETAESVSATDPRILRAYVMRSKTLARSEYFYDSFLLATPLGQSNFFLAHYDVMADKVRHIVGNLAGGALPPTGVFVQSGTFEGYARGAVLAQDADGNPVIFAAPGSDSDSESDGFHDIVGYAENYMAYQEIRESLVAAFRQKTESFGLSGVEMGDMVDKGLAEDAYGLAKEGLPDSFTYIKGDGELVISGEMKGIVYCAAASDSVLGPDETNQEADGPGSLTESALPTLRISGDGTFRGTIICEGDIVIEGSPQIWYDETVISRAILSSADVRAFFAPGELGDVSHVRLQRLAEGVTRLREERYEIESWTEGQG